MKEQNRKPNLLQNLVLAGIGLDRMIQEKAEKFVEDLIKKGEEADDRRSKAIRQGLNKLEKFGNSLFTPTSSRREQQPESDPKQRQMQERVDSLNRQLRELQSEQPDEPARGPSEQENANDQEFAANKHPIGAKSK